LELSWELQDFAESGCLDMQPLADTFYAPSNTPVWALHNECSLQIHILTGPMDQTPALSQGILTSAYA
jgi:hypothetical protein